MRNPAHRFVRVKHFAFFFFMLVASWSCSRHLDAPIFDADRAFILLKIQTDMGPRVPGSAGWRDFQAYFRKWADSLGISTAEQPFAYADYLTGDTIPLVNLIMRINPKQSDRILLAAHYDTRPRSDYDPDSTKRHLPILGANDGASGTAVLMHLAELMVFNPPVVGVDLVLFDGEDWGQPGKLDQYLLGSQHFAAVNNTEYRFGILLDMIGDSNLKLYREAYSDLYAKDYNDIVWSAAARLGEKAFVDSAGPEVIDDHVPLISAGIPTINIIDFDYPSWHTTADTQDKCSPASLGVVGRVVLEVIYGTR